MINVTVNGQEGFFLTKEEKEQVRIILETCSEICEKVIQDANNT